MKRKRWEKGNLEESRLVLCTTLELPTQEGRFGQYTCNNLALLSFFWKINPAYARDTPMILKLCASSISVPFPTKFTQKTELKKFLKKKSRLLLQKREYLLSLKEQETAAKDTDMTRASREKVYFSRVKLHYSLRLSCLATCNIIYLNAFE